jgi:outer membrane murein-binding lipoprotein Lpp
LININMKRLIQMKNIMTVAAVAALALSLTGCIAVADGDGPSSISENTELAVRVCGGEGNVAEVTDDGYRCKVPAN